MSSRLGGARAGLGGGVPRDRARPGLGRSSLGGRQLIGSEASRVILLTLAIGGVSWLTMARVIRGQVPSLREQPFIEAACALGLPTARILLRHVLANRAGPIINFAPLTVPQAILQESFLSFLDVDVQPPQATWGSLADDGVRLLNPIRVDWWVVVFPCAASARPRCLSPKLPYITPAQIRPFRSVIRTHHPWLICRWFRHKLTAARTFWGLV